MFSQKTLQPVKKYFKMAIKEVKNENYNFYRGFIFNLMICFLGVESIPNCQPTHLCWDVWNRVPLAIQKWREYNTGTLVELRHTKVLILNFSLIRRSNLRVS